MPQRTTDPKRGTGGYRLERNMLKAAVEDIRAVAEDSVYWPVRSILKEAWESGKTFHAWAEEERENDREPIHDAINVYEKATGADEVHPQVVRAIENMRHLDRIGAGKIRFTGEDDEFVQGGAPFGRTRQFAPQGESYGEPVPVPSPEPLSRKEIERNQNELVARGAEARERRERGEPSRANVPFEIPSDIFPDLAPEGQEYMRHGWFRDQAGKDAAGEVKRRPAPKAGEKPAGKKPTKKRPVKKRATRRRTQ